MTSERVLVVAGEPSGDRTLAKVVRAMGAPSFGIGGDALAALGTDLVAHVRDVSGMGGVELAARIPTIARALVRLRRMVRELRPRVALLASWSAANARIGARLRGMGVRVIWISPPEIWAWRPGRARALTRSADRMIVTLPFEEAMWREAGADARFLGHPALEDVRASARARPDQTRGARLAILPGSRPAEIDRLLDAFVGAASLLDLGPGSARLIVAPGLPSPARAKIAAAARVACIETIDAPADSGASAFLGAFDVALVASGTASLEAAMAGTPPVIAYRMHPLTMAIAKRLVRTDHIALPNVLLARAGLGAPFRERLQEQVTPAALAAAITATLGDPSCARGCEAIVRVLDPKLPGTFGERVVAAI